MTHFQRRTLEADPQFAAALFNRDIITEPEDLDEATVFYRKAIDANPKFAPAHMRLGFALVELGHRAEGEQMLGRGIALDPAMNRVDTPSYGS